MDPNRKKLEDIKSLLDSQLISEKEYYSLKEEILFNDKVKLSKETFSNQNGKNDIKNVFVSQKQLKSSSKANPATIFIAIVFAIVFVLVIEGSKGKSNVNSSNNNEASSSQTTIPVKQEVGSKCDICGRTFHNRGYEEVSEGVYQEIKEGQGSLCSSNCARKATQNLYDVANKYIKAKNNSRVNDPPIQHYGEYHEGSDGRIYENSPCELCRGTGYEINTAQRILGGPSRRVCPMCHGKGVMSY